MSRQPHTLDWQEAQARLERVRRSLAGDARTPEEAARILRDRARALAKPQETVEADEETLALLVFSLAGERFGIDTGPVREVVLARELIPVPCTPAWILGLLHYRGRILVVVDLLRVLDLPAEREAAPRYCVWVEVGSLMFGIAADRIEGVAAVPARAVATAVGLTGRRQAVTQGMTDDLITVLDLDALARSPEIVVNDEGGLQREVSP